MDQKITDLNKRMDISANNNHTSGITKNILELGFIMLSSGAEVSRVEDTLSRIGNAYSFRQIEVMTITNCILITVEDSNGIICSQLKRVLNISVDMEKVRACNALSRKICSKLLSEEEFSEEIEKIHNTKSYSQLTKYFIYMLTASSMTVFFGGNLMDFFAAFLSGFAMCLVVTVVKRAHMQNFVTNFIVSFLVGSVIYILVKLGIGQNYDKIVMGNIMLLISGSGLMTSVRDMINNDLISGMMGFLSATICAAAIALGFVTVVSIF